MLYVFEHKHTDELICWGAFSRSDFVAKIADRAARRGQSIDTFDAAMKWLRPNLKLGQIYVSAFSAARAMAQGSGVFAEPSRARAIEAFERCRVLHGEPVEHDAVAAVHAGLRHSVPPSKTPIKIAQQSFARSHAPGLRFLPGTHTAAMAYLDLCPMGVVSVATARNRDGTLTRRERYNERITWLLPSKVRSSSLSAVVQACIPLLRLVHEGRTVVDSPYGHYGVLSAQAQGAYRVIEEHLAQLYLPEHLCRVYTCEQYLHETLSTDIARSWPASATVTMVSDRLMEQVQAQGDVVHLVDENMRGAVLQWAMRLFVSAAQQLQPHHARALLENALIDAGQFNAFMQHHSPCTQ